MFLCIYAFARMCGDALAFRISIRTVYELNCTRCWDWYMARSHQDRTQSTSSTDKMPQKSRRRSKKSSRWRQSRRYRWWAHRRHRHHPACPLTRLNNGRASPRRRRASRTSRERSSTSWRTKLPSSTHKSRFWQRSWRQLSLGTLSHFPSGQKSSRRSGRTLLLRRVDG